MPPESRDGRPDDALDDAFLARLHAAPPSETARLLSDYTCSLAQRFLGFEDDDEVRADDRFLDLGFDSLRAVDFKILLEQRLGCALPSTVLFDCPTPDDLVQHLRDALDGTRARTPSASALPSRRTHELPDEATLAALPRDELLALARRQGALIRSLEDARSEPIAIVGMACRFPGGADDVDAYWRLQRDGRDAIVDVPPDRWDAARLYDPDPAAPGRTYVRQGGFLSDVRRFDAGFFGISPREAQQLDPQQRVLLEVTWEALEDAALSADALKGAPVGVFVGQRGAEYFTGHSDWAPEDATTYYATGNAASTMAGRISYVLGLTGPCQAIDTACSSSLVAVHDALQSLRRGECSAALAAGVNLLLDPFGTIAISKASMLSRDARCKTFDASADGYVRSEGCGVLVLMRLSRALSEGHRVLALVRGSASNQDGAGSGLTVPNGKAQEDVIRRALRDAGLRPDEIDYVEAHGTGTSLGDPIEIAALDAVFGPGRERPLLVGSVKTNIGHSEPAAGVAGLIKVVLALRHAALPPHLHLREPNPHVPWDKSVVRVPLETTPWPAGPRPRIAGVSSFGFGGTNAHVVLSEAPPEAARASGVERPVQPFVLATHDASALTELAARTRDALARDDAPSLLDAAYTSCVGRARLPRRAVLLAADRAELVARLDDVAAGRDAGIRGKASPPGPRVAFLFTGQGSQSPGMGQQLYATFPAYREALDACADALGPHLEVDLREVLFGARGELLSRTDSTQPALFALEYALAATWGALGVRPTWVLGHSVGEYAAACLAGVLSLEDAAALVAARGRLMVEHTPPGAMVTVFADADVLRPHLLAHPDELSIAAWNCSGHLVLSGSAARVADVTARLQSDGVRCKPLDVSHAFHSPLMDPMLAAFADVARGLTLHAPQLGFVSCVDPRPVRDELTTPEYWVRHVREPVRFVEGMTALAAQDCDAFVEIGPAPVLLGMARRFVDEGGRAWLPSLRPGTGDCARLLESVAELLVRGAPIDGEALFRGTGARRCALPTHPFQREEHWLPGRRAHARREVAPGAHPLLGAALDSPALPSDVRVHETRLAERDPRWLADHRAYDAVVLPAAAFVELALAAGDATSALSAFALDAPLVLDADGARVQVVVRDADDGATREVEILSRRDDAGAWTRHAHGRLLSADAIDARAHDDGGRDGGRDDDDDTLDAIERRCDESLDVDGFYALYDEVGLTYDPSFRALRALRCGDDECLADVTLPEGLDASPAWRLHPVLLDACFQAARALALQRGLEDMYLPVGFERVVVRRAPSRSVRCHVRLRSVAGDGRLLLVDLRLLDRDGAELAQIEGQQLLRTTRSAFLAAADPLAALGHVVAWEDFDLDDAARAHADVNSEAEADAGSTLVLGAPDGPARALADALVASGASVELVAPADVDRGGDVDASAAAFAERLGARSHWRAVIVASALDGWTPDDATSGAAHADAHAPDALASGAHAFVPAPDDVRRDALLAPLPGLMRALEREPSASGARLVFVTRGAVAADDLPRPLDLDAACLWGLGASAALEHVQRGCLRVDLDPALAPRVDDEASVTARAAECARLVDALRRAPPTEDRLALRDGRLRVARLLRAAQVARGGLRPPEAPGYRLAVSSYGSLERLALLPLTPRAPAAGEVRIAVEAAALNFKDVLFALGLLREHTGIVHAPDQPLGLECAGRVESIGPGVTDLAVGQRVFASCAGAFASHVVVPRHAVAAIPGTLDTPRAAGVQTVFLTALFGLRRCARLRRGERVLIHAAAGGVGQAALQLARLAGAEVFATASRGKHAHLRAQGVTHVFDSRTPAFAEAILSATGGRGVDVVLNSLSGEALDASLRCLARGGRFVEIGKIGIRTPEAFVAERPDAEYHAFDMADVLGADPALHRALLDELVDGLARGELVPPPTTVVPLRDAVTAFTRLAQAKLVGKLVLTLPPPRGGEPRLRPEGCQLVTGGTGALGLACAGLLVDAGARHLVLAARRAPSADAQERIDALRARGADVRVAQLDVSDRAALEALLASLEHPLDGVLHAAGVLDDGLLANLDGERMRRVLDPKVLGALHLHELAPKDLSFFVCFSSMVSLTGAAGQSSYAAANAWLDALAQHRRAQGLCGVSLGWGPWAGAGMAAASEERNRARFAERGIGSIDPEQGLAVLRRVLAEPDGPAHLGVLPVDWTRHLATYPGEVPGFLSRLATTTARATSDASDDDVLERLLALDDDAARRALLLAWLGEQLARVMGGTAGALDASRPLVEMGVDSLLAVDLRNRLETSLRRDLPATLVFDHPTLDALVAHLLELLDGDGDDVLDADESALLDEIEGLDEHEARRLLDETHG
ncbi:MAG: SDR family NAD(P)-dependent oxidoreductase [Planctomycetes bacterium]|nr:SDR family NAD(P)-dependent oxidoreductase [Planctomycetota bacterium]MCB9916718.1 SDR family NAD(P)-dependent oxidoreductase [Planctomycetota bacterium]